MCESNLPNVESLDSEAKKAYQNTNPQDPVLAQMYFEILDQNLYDSCNLAKGFLSPEIDFPSRLEGSLLTESCWICNQSQTELVVHENNDNRGRNRFLHTTCISDYLSQIDGKWAAIVAVFNAQEYQDMSGTVFEHLRDMRATEQEERNQRNKEYREREDKHQ